MRTIRMGTVGYAAAIAALSLSSLQAQTVQTSLAKEAGTLSDKFGGLARVMAGKCDWKQHERLGQSIAYARTNGVVPPWSK